MNKRGLGYITVKVTDLNYSVRTPDRRKKTHLCHINMLKSYVNRDKNKLVYYVITVSPVKIVTIYRYVIHRIHRTLKISPGFSRLLGYSL